MEFMDEGLIGKILMIIILHQPIIIIILKVMFPILQAGYKGEKKGKELLGIKPRLLA